MIQMAAKKRSVLMMQIMVVIASLILLHALQSRQKKRRLASENPRRDFFKNLPLVRRAETTLTLICVSEIRCADGNCIRLTTFHKYAYVHGDPISNIDPTGKFLAGLALGSSFGTSLRNLKLDFDLAAFDAITTVLLNHDANQSTLDLFSIYIRNQALGFGFGSVLNVVSRYGKFLFLRLGKVGAKADFQVGASSNYQNLRNTRNFSPGRIQTAGDTCGLECAGRILDEVNPNRSVTSLDASFGTTAHEILKSRTGKGLDTKQLSNLIENNSEAAATVKHSWTRDDLEDWLNAPNSHVISRVDNNHFVHPLRIFEDEGQTWVRVYDPAQGFYDQLLDSFVTRANHGQVIRVTN